MIHYGRAPFLDQFPRSRVPSYPRHKGPLSSEVVVDRRRADRMRGRLRVCRRRHPGHARRGRPHGRRRHQRRSRDGFPRIPGSGSSSVEKLIGLKTARHAFQAWRRAALDFAALLRRLDIQCHLEAHSALTVAFTPEQIARLKKEHKARVDAGLETPALNARAVSAEVALDAAFALRGRDGATHRSLSRLSRAREGGG